MPSNANLPGRDAVYSYMSTFHWKPLLNGYSGYYPRSYLARLDRLEKFPDFQAMESLREDDVTYVIVHADTYSSAEFESIVEALTDSRLRPLGRFNNGNSAGGSFQHAMRSMINDAHCHFFSSRYLELLTQGMTDLPAEDRAEAVAERLQWAPPGTAEQLADRWIEELDRHGVSRAALISSIPGDEDSVAAAVARHPRRFVGFFMVNPAAADAEQRLTHAFGEQRPSLRLPVPRDAPISAGRSARYEGVRGGGGPSGRRVRALRCADGRAFARSSAMRSVFDLTFGDPLAVAAHAAQFPSVPVIIPHFGAGFFRETLMAAGQSPNIHLDTSSSNSWMKYYPGLTLDNVFRQALDATGPERLLFGTDSSFFPRGWQEEVFDVQYAALEAVGVAEADRALLFGANFDRLFPE